MTLSTNYTVLYHSFKVQVRNKIILLNTCDYGMYISYTHRYKGGVKLCLFQQIDR